MVKIRIKWIEYGKNQPISEAVNSQRELNSTEKIPHTRQVFLFVKGNVK